MSQIKRKQAGPYSYDDDEDYVPGAGVKYSSKDEDAGPAKKKAHTLDSDEEEEDDAETAGEGRSYDVLKEDDIKGQEDETVQFEGETKITPFNMKEEMEEGHFDGDGFYHFKKNSEQVKDAWLDDIDWMKIKHSEEAVNKYGSDIESSSDDDSIADTGVGLKLPGSKKKQQLQEANNDDDEIRQLYSSMIEFLKPGETVTRALKRLGGGKKLTSAQKWKQKKKLQENKASNGVEAGNTSDDMTKMLQLTDFANKLVQFGNMDVYQETYESIKVKVEPPVKSSSPAYDMFSDGPETAAASKDKPPEATADDSIKWELKWDNKDEAEIHGPFPSSQMVQWQESGYFEKGAYVRKIVDSGGPWYRTDRIDFELYT